MAQSKKKKYEDEEFDTPKDEPKAEIAMAPKKSVMLKASEWALSDADRPDPHLFSWWDKKGVMAKEKYEEIKQQVFRKK